MKKTLSLITALIILLVSIASYSQTLVPYAFPFIGRWQAYEDPLLIDEYGLQDVQNLRKAGKHFKGVAGHTVINTSSQSTYHYTLNGFHFRKDQPQESHVIIYSADGYSPTAGRLYQNTTAIPNQGNFQGTALHTPTTFTDPWRFSNAPAGNMVASNGAETLIWGGNEIEATVLITSTDSMTGSSVTLTNPNDYSDQVKNIQFTSDQVAVIGGGNDSYTKLLLHGDGTEGSTTITDSSSGAKIITSAGSAPGATISTLQKKFGTGSIILTSASSTYITTADHDDWTFGTGNFTIDFWIKFNTTLGAWKQLVGQYADSNNYWHLRYASGQVSFKYVSGGTTQAYYYGNISITTGTWYHFALTRSLAGAKLRMTVDGVENTLTAATPIAGKDLANIAAPLEIGREGSGAGYFDGYIDEFRISKGVARWEVPIFDTLSFVPLSRAYSAPSNYWVVGSKRPLQGVKFYVSDANTETSTMTVKEWNGSSWTALSATDNTASGGISLAQTGTVTWTSTVDTSKTRYINGLSLYWYQFGITSGSATIYYATVDAPMQEIRNIWDGIEGYVVKCLKYNGTTYLDYTDQVGDSSDSTYADFSSLATTHALYLGFLEPQQALNFKFVAGSENATASTQMTVSFWNGSEWQEATAISDGTATSTTSFSKGGIASFQGAIPGTEFKKAISDEYLLYYYKLQFAGTLDADVKVSEIRGIENPPTMSKYKFSEVFQNRLFLFNDASGDKNKAVYSVYNAPDLFNGDDSGYLMFGDRTEITAASVVYNVFTSTAIEQLIVTKKNETYRVSGSDPSSWVTQRMSTNIGCVAPLTMVSCDVFETQDIKRTIAMWVSDKGVVMSDGAAIIPVSDDIKRYWDPNDTDYYITAANQPKSFAWYDPSIQSYKLLIAAGDKATSLNTELEYSLKYKEWTKVYRENAAGANPLMSGWRVFDTSGVGYTYGGAADGFVYRLENGTDWNSKADIAQYLQTKDMILDNQAPLFRLSTVKYIRTAYKKKTAATGNLSIAHYCDRTLSVTGTKGAYTPSVITNVPTTWYNTQSVNLGPCLYHSFKFSQTTDTTDGMELTGAGVYYEPLTTIR